MEYLKPILSAGQPAAHLVLGGEKDGDDIDPPHSSLPTQPEGLLGMDE